MLSTGIARTMTPSAIWSAETLSMRGWNMASFSASSVACALACFIRSSIS